MSRMVAVVFGSLLLGSVASAQVTQVISLPNGQIVNVQGGVVFGDASSQAPARDGRQAPPGTATLRGRVLAADTGQPLRKAQVRINSTGPNAVGLPPENRLASTDADGRYQFTQLRAGRYTLMAQKGSFIQLQWGQVRPNEGGKPIDILDGQTIEKVDFALPRGGVITGRVLDEFNEPVSDVQVGVMRLQNVGGTRRLMNAGRTSMTNDIGEFRVFALPPGDYYVSAIFRSGNPLAENDDRTGYAPIYYPGTPDVATAQKLTVAAGQTITDIQLSLTPIRTARASGSAVDSQGRPMRGLVQAIMQSATVGMPMGASGGPIRPDGSFTINGLTPGDYTLQVQPQGGPGGPPADPEYASTTISVNGSDITGIQLVASKPSSISGRFVIPSIGDAKTLRPSSLRVGAFPAPNGTPVFGPTPQPGPVSDDWTFETKSRPGAMRLNVQGIQPPWTVKAIRHRGIDVTDTGLEAKANEDLNDVEIELTNRSTNVSGSVTNTRGEPVRDYWAVLFARDREKWRPQSRYVRISRPDQEGRFKVTGLPPGEYLVVASDSLDPSEATDPEFLDRIQARATRLTLGEGESKTIDLKLSAIP